jgi:hypothetical protein
MKSRRLFSFLAFLLEPNEVSNAENIHPRDSFSCSSARFPIETRKGKIFIECEICSPAYSLAAFQWNVVVLDMRATTFAEAQSTGNADESRASFRASNIGNPSTARI